LIIRDVFVEEFSAELDDVLLIPWGETDIVMIFRVELLLLS
jgi:hypothetical protein